MDNTVNIALPKGRLGERVYSIFEHESAADSRKLIFENKEKAVRYFWVKPSDVPIYVERGAADLGVCGKDWKPQDQQRQNFLPGCNGT